MPCSYCTTPAEALAETKLSPKPGEYKEYSSVLFTKSGDSGLYLVFGTGSTTGLSCLA